MQWVGNSADWNDSFRKFYYSFEHPEMSPSKYGKKSPLNGLNLFQVWRKSPPRRFESVLHPLNLDPSTVSIRQNDFLKSNRFGFFSTFCHISSNVNWVFTVKKFKPCFFFFFCVALNQMASLEIPVHASQTETQRDSVSRL